MLSEQEKHIYDRQIRLNEVGISGQEKLKASKVLVVGAGGLGCPALQYLTAAGIGTIGIADFDQVDVSNLQRQVLFGHSSIGKNKAIESIKRLYDLNPNVVFEAHEEGVTVSNAREIIREYDIIVDCSDNYATRYLINDVCVLEGKPFVSGSIHQFEGQITVLNYEGGPTYRCLYPELPKEASVASCDEVGVIGVLPGIIGTYQANEVLKIVLELGEVLSGKLLTIDSRINSTYTFNIQRRPNDRYSKLSKNGLNANDYDFDCNKASAIDQLLEQYEQVIDVRELHEIDPVSDKNYIHIPLGEVETRSTEIDKKKTTVVICRSGMRSQKAIEVLSRFNFNNLKNLEGGINSIN